MLNRQIKTLNCKQALEDISQRIISNPKQVLSLAEGVSASKGVKEFQRE